MVLASKCSLFSFHLGVTFGLRLKADIIQNVIDSGVSRFTETIDFSKGVPPKPLILARGCSLFGFHLGVTFGLRLKVDIMQNVIDFGVSRLTETIDVINEMCSFQLLSRCFVRSLGEG